MYVGFAKRVGFGRFVPHGGGIDRREASVRPLPICGGRIGDRIDLDARDANRAGAGRRGPLLGLVLLDQRTGPRAHAEPDPSRSAERSLEVVLRLRVRPRGRQLGSVPPGGLNRALIFSDGCGIAR